MMYKKGPIQKAVDSIEFKLFGRSGKPIMKFNKAPNNLPLAKKLLKKKGIEL